MAHRPPKYRHHKPTGQAVVTLGGRDCYLGRHGTPESRAEYDRMIAEWLASGRGTPPAPAAVAASTLSVTGLIKLYLEHAQVEYRDASGAQTDTLKNIKVALRHIRALYGHTDAVSFGPVALKIVRQQMIDSGLCRNTVNGRIGQIKRLFKWGVGNEHIASSVYHGLQSVEGLRRGRGVARESVPVTPVSAEHVRAVLPFVSPPIRAMIELQSLCGARPGEICRMRTGDLDRVTSIWVYRPGSHKSQHLGRGRAIPLGPKAQQVVTPWLKADLAAYLFSPREAAELTHATRRCGRKTPMTPSQASRQRKADPKRAPREKYDRFGYRRAVARACKRAGVPVWHPNQLRHSVATTVRARFGLEAAQVVLGHSRADVTQVYAERDLGKAIDVMREVG